jgi:hypothetical protein
MWGCFGLSIILRYVPGNALFRPSLWASSLYEYIQTARSPQVKPAYLTGCYFSVTSLHVFARLLAPCGDMPELLAVWEVTLMGRFSADRYWLICLLTWLVCQNCWLPTDREFWWRACISELLWPSQFFFFPVHFLQSILVSQEPIN